MAETSGCNLNSTEKIADCIRNLDYGAVKTIGKVRRLIYRLDPFSESLMCVYFSFVFSLQDKKFIVSINVDGHFLTKPVDELFQRHELITVPFMTGVNSDEGGLIVPRVRFLSFTDFIFCVAGEHVSAFETNCICVFPQFFGVTVRPEGMDREEVTNVMAFFYSDVRPTLSHIPVLLLLIIFKRL